MPKENLETRLNIRISQSVKEALDKQAASTGLTTSKFVRVMVELLSESTKSELIKLSEEYEQQVRELDRMRQLVKEEQQTYFKLREKWLRQKDENEEFQVATLHMKIKAHADQDMRLFTGVDK